MKKRLIASFTAMSMLISTVGVSVFADEPVFDEEGAEVELMATDASGTCGDNLTWTLDSAGTLTISGTGDMRDWRVTSGNSAWWYGYRDNIKKVIINNGVTSIYSDAFSGCSSLISVSIPDSVTSIGERAFSNCSSLISVSIPDSITSIGRSAFEHCSSLTSVTLPDSVTSIGHEEFQGCSSLISIIIPDGVTSIGASAFYGCISLTSIIIPDSVTRISNWAFYGCISLENVIIPDGVTSIDGYTFSGCRSLTSITIPDGITSIGDDAFFGCRSLTSVTIPNSVTRIGDTAFGNCISLTSIIIPDSVTSIDNYAFSGCSHLTNVYYGGTKEEWDNIQIGEVNEYLTNAVRRYNPILDSGACGDGGKWTLDKSGELTITGNGMMDNFNDENAPWYKYKDRIKKIVIANGITAIGDNAFSGCRNLTELYIPKSVNTIGKNILEGCMKLETLSTPFIGTNRQDANTETSVLGAFFGFNDADITGSMQYYNENGDFHYYKVPRTLKNVSVLNQANIPYGAFAECDFLEKVAIVSGVSMAKHVFYHCASLKSITLPNELQNIGCEAFAECENLEDINIPAKVRAIEEQAFYNCRSLKNITMPDSIKEIAEDVFNGTNLFGEVTLMANIGAITCSEGSAAYDYAIKKNIQANTVSSEELDIKKTSTTATLSLIDTYFFNVTDANRINGTLHVELYDEDDNKLAEKAITANDLEYKIEFARTDNVEKAKIYIISEDGVPTTAEWLESKDIPKIPESNLEIAYYDGTASFVGTTPIDETGALLIQAVYNEDNIVEALKTYPITNLDDVIVEPFGGKKMKFMLWNSVDSMKPLAKTDVYEGTDI